VKQVDAGFSDQVHEPVFLGDPPGPSTFGEVLQGFGFADAVEGIAYHFLHQREDAQCRPAIVLHPILAVFDELRLKDGRPAASRQRP
jgi:hypothetical protein